MSFSPLKGDFIGKEALRAQFEEVKAREEGHLLSPKEKQVVPRRVQPVTVTGQGIARQGYEIFFRATLAGHVTSGTMVPYWVFPDKGILSGPSDEKKMRSIALVYADADLEEGDKIEIRQKGKTFEAVIVERHLSAEAPPYAHPILLQEVESTKRPERTEGSCHGSCDGGGAEPPLETEGYHQPDSFRNDSFPSRQIAHHPGPLRPVR
jgi:aminomethyltransferase